MTVRAGSQVGLDTGVNLSWGNNFTQAFDTGLGRTSAGLVEVNNGTLGTFRDLKLRVLTATGASPALILSAYTTAGLLQNDASGNVTTNTAVVASTIPANFIAADRLTVVISGTTYYIPLATVAF